MNKIAFALAITALASEASAYCSKPSAPYCAERFGKFDDQWDFDRCKSEMESYRSEVESYISCVRRDAQSDIDRAVSDHSNAVDSFNRRARSDY